MATRAGISLLVGIAAAAVVGLACVAWSAAERRAEIGQEAKALTGGDAERAPDLLTRYGCAGCHTIPGVPGADGRVGPALSGLREQVYVGGVLRNTAGNLVAWIVDPHRVSPRSAMPATGITEAEARDVAAYLYQH
jgi:cytochrome c